MNLLFITCSGVNEHTEISALVQMLQDYPLAEIGIQVSNAKCAFDSERYDWIRHLHAYVSSHFIPIRAALHVNSKWAEDIGQGAVASELQNLLELEDFRHQPFFQRVQLNFKIGREKAPDEAQLLSVMRLYGNHRFILSYNSSNKELIEHLYKRGAVFDCLFDSSFGEGIAPKAREEPAFVDVVQGYAGGISPENVTQVLEQIDSYHHPTGIYIDAEGKLKDASGHISLLNAQRYLQNATEWAESNRCI